MRSARYRPRYRFFFWLFVSTCVGLGWLGSKPAEGIYVYAARVLTIYYFAHFLVILPLLGRYETTAAAAELDHRMIRAQARADRRSRRRSIALQRVMLAGSARTVVAEPAGGRRRRHAAEAASGRSADRSASSIAASSSAASRSIARSARPATASRWCRSAISPSRAARASPTAQAAAIAAEYQVPAEPDDQGEVKDRPGRLADRFPAPFKNDNQARARYNAVPPDLSVIVKARGYERGFPWFILDLFTAYQEHGADYMVALLTGYADAPKGTEAPPGTFYNKYFPGHFLAMPPPLSDGRIDYTDGTKPTADQLARDVTAFLAWAAEPHLEARKRIGLQVIIFLHRVRGAALFHQEEGVEVGRARTAERCPTLAERI